MAQPAMESDPDAKRWTKSLTQSQLRDLFNEYRAALVSPYLH